MYKKYIYHWYKRRRLATWVGTDWNTVGGGGQGGGVSRPQVPVYVTREFTGNLLRLHIEVKS